MTEDEKVEARNIAMYKTEWLEVDALARALAQRAGGRPNVSSAVRTIIRERREMLDPKQERRQLRLRELARGHFTGTITPAEFAQEAALLILGLMEPEAAMSGKAVPEHSGG